MKITQTQIHNGFFLQEPVLFSTPIVVLTGRNGSGKTRFIESLQRGLSTAQIEGNQLNQSPIRLITQQNIMPSLGGGYSDTQRTNRITSTLASYERIKQNLLNPLPQENAHLLHRSMGDEMNYIQLHNLANSISKKLNKPIDQLTHDEIILHFNESPGEIIGTTDISTISNTYIKRLHTNKINEYFYQKGDDVPFYNDDEFNAEFGRRPWLVINEIVQKIFDGKFHFSFPDEKLKSYSYHACLLDVNNNEANVNTLSSGEKTLLWLAITLFNTQYHQQESGSEIIPKILLLDEPDAFLHPKMVEKMYNTLNSFTENFGTKIILTTHSPTTAALAPEKSLYLVDENKIISIDKDQAISELLDGISQISINPHNRRQVYVESIHDYRALQALFNHLKTKSTLLDPKISITFVSSGPKTPVKQIEDTIKSVLDISDHQKITAFIEHLNGVGSCSQVYGTVDALVNCGNNTVRGLVDWDTTNKPTQHVVVLAENHAYTIENILLDPICILLQLHMNHPEKYLVKEICKADVTWHDWINNSELCQNSIDYYLQKLFETPNNRDADHIYTSGLQLKTDTRYLRYQGHRLEEFIVFKFPDLKSITKNSKSSKLAYHIATRVMINITCGKFIPKLFEQAFQQLQK